MARRGSSQWWYDTWGTPCRSQMMKRVTLGRATITVDQRIQEAVEALGAVFKTWRYDVRPGYPEGDTGAYNCRRQRHDPNAPHSVHAWGGAVDVNWQTNPAGKTLRTDMKRGMVDDVLRIKTRSGQQVWRWGGDWDSDGDSSDHSYVDAMHYEVYATPGELASGIDWSTVNRGGTWMASKYVYGKRGTVDKGMPELLLDVIPVEGVVPLIHPQDVRKVVDSGGTVFLIGGPACREFDQGNDQGVLDRGNGFVTVQGQTGADTLDLAFGLARRGWTLG